MAQQNRDVLGLTGDFERGLINFDTSKNPSMHVISSGLPRSSLCLHVWSSSRWFSGDPAQALLQMQQRQSQWALPAGWYTRARPLVLVGVYLSMALRVGLRSSSK